MRLIDVKTLELKEFFHSPPPYAILSHTWGHEELTFQEYLLATDPNANAHAHIRKKAGFPKIVGACKRAHADGLGYLWCDTNCIDKSSSAELSEAINSMYAWYHDSYVCYAYLADVEAGIHVRVEHGGSMNSRLFKESRWFTRGWTLQELLAPQKVVFFDKQWRVLGDRMGLADDIARITRIHIEALRDRNAVPGFSIAQRMSWAANRQTSRQEDIAYSLLGIFNINMPLIYGEGSKAFIRFQQEIIRISDDQSILAWDSSDSLLAANAFAQSPRAFQACGSLVRDLDMKESSSLLTSTGISMEVPVVQTSLSGVILVGLNCCRELRFLGRNQRTHGNRELSRRDQVWIWVRRSGHDIYERIHIPESNTYLDKWYHITSGSRTKHIFLSTSATVASALAPQRGYCNIEKSNRPSDAGFHVTFASGTVYDQTRAYETVYPMGNWTVTCLSNRGRSTISHLLVSNSSFSTVLSIAWDETEQPQVWLHTTFPDIECRFSRMMSTSRRWENLFNCYGQGEMEVLSSRLRKLHTQLKELDGRASSHPLPSQPPLIHVSNEVLHNLQGQAEVGVDIIFRETPKPLTSRNVSQLLHM